MLRLRSDDVLGSLAECYRKVAGSAAGGGFEGSVSGGSVIDRRLGKQCDLALASSVVSFIERELPRHAADYFRFLCADGEDLYPAYCAVLTAADDELDESVQGRRRKVVLNVGRLSMLVPWEVRHRAWHAGAVKHSTQELADLLGISWNGFKKTYSPQWLAMVDSLLSVGDEFEPMLAECFAGGWDDVAGRLAVGQLSSAEVDAELARYFAMFAGNDSCGGACGTVEDAA